MDKIKFISHNAFSGINDLKTACLYFDHIEVANHFRPYILGEVNAKAEKHKNGKYYMPGKLHIEEHFIDADYKGHISPLIDAGLVSLKYEPYMTEEVVDKSKNYVAVGDPSLNLNSFLLMSYKRFFSEVHEEMGEDELGNKTISFKGPLLTETASVIGTLKGASKDTDMNFIYKYYGHLLSALLRNLDAGEKVISTSKILDHLLIDYYNNDDFQETRVKLGKELNLEPSIAFDAIRFALPNVSTLSMEDVLDIRDKLHSELESFRHYCKQLQLEFETAGVDSKYLRAKSTEIVAAKINPAVEDLSKKLKGLNLSIPLNLLKELKDPKSYSPLLLSFTNNISNTYAILISLGLMTFSTAVDYYRSKKEIKNNGIYYLLKLKNYG